MGRLQSINPATGERITDYEEMSSATIAETVKAADAAFREWRGVDFGTRALRLKRSAEVLRSRRSEYARLMALEMGKPLGQGAAEVDKCAWVCDYYAEQGAQFLAPELVATDASKSYIAFEPLGVVLAVMPWNFPFWQVFRFAAPAIMAGNAVLLKHASNVSGCALAIEGIFREAGIPSDLFRTLLIGSSSVPGVLANPQVRAVTLTGSTPAGRAVATQAGSLLKKCVLELGGSDPYLILEDADPEAAAATCVTARLFNGGQSCIAAKRMLVVEPRRATFESLVVEKMRSKRMGNPLQEGTEIGPLARSDLRDQLHQQVQRSVAAGARLLLGGDLPQGPGAYYPPTVLTDVGPGMPAYEEEIFGPVAVIIPVKNEAEAIRIANDSAFGLGSAVFTRDLARGERIAARELEAGSCFVNAGVKSDPRLPFGGVKQSGFGRELSVFGIREFVNIKTVFVK